MHSWDALHQRQDSTLIATLIAPPLLVSIDWAYAFAALQKPALNDTMRMTGLPWGEGRTQCAYECLNRGHQYLFFLDSVPSYTPLLVKEKATGLLDILPISMLAEFHDEGGLERVPCDKYLVRFADGTKGKGFTAIKHVIRHPYEGDLVRITTKGGTIDISPNHSIYRRSNKKGQSLTDASTISLKDKMVMPTLPGYRRHRNTFFLGREDLAWLYGFFAAEGSVGHKNGLPATVRISNTNRALIQKAQDILHDYFNRPFHVVTDKSKGNPVYHVQASDIALGRFFDKLFYTDAGDKKIPKVILNARTKVKLAFLQGYHDGDGHKRATQQLAFESFATVSPCLAEGIIFLLHCLDLTEVGVFRRPDKLNAIHLYVGKGLYERKNRYQVKEISSIRYSGYLYDISTETEKFIGGVGGFLLHNSDVLLPPHALMRLLSLRLPVVSALYHQKFPTWTGSEVKYMPCMFNEGRDDKGNVARVEVPFQYGQIVEAHFVPAGALLVHRSVFERFQQAGIKKFFQWTMNIDTPQGFSEDFFFSRTCWQLGIKCFVDTSIQAIHESLAKVDTRGLSAKL